MHRRRRRHRAGLVTCGWAVADSAGAEAYGAAEAAARAAGAGARAGQFFAPAAYHELIAATEALPRRRPKRARRGRSRPRRRYAGPAASSPRRRRKPRRRPPSGRCASPPRAGAHRCRRAGARHLTAAPPRRSKPSGRRPSRRSPPISPRPSGRPCRAPGPTVATADAAAFLRRVTAGAAAWRAAGRQPLLHVMAPDQPALVRDWFAGQRPPAPSSRAAPSARAPPIWVPSTASTSIWGPAGARRTARPCRPPAAVTYRRDAAGHVLALDAPATPGAWTLRYAAALGWRDDPVLWLAFPRRAAPTPDAG